MYAQHRLLLRQGKKLFIYSGLCQNHTTVDHKRLPLKTHLKSMKIGKKFCV